MKQKIAPILLIAGIVILAFVSYRSRQTVYNSDSVSGNSSGNLFNGGLFCEYEDKIYFSNPTDEGRLYVMDSDLSNPKKLSSDTAQSINVAGKYIIYGRHNNLQEQSNENVLEVSSTGLYRMEKNGKNLKTLYDAVVNVVNLYGNQVYFTHNDTSGITVSQIDIDKSNFKDLITQAVFPYAIAEGSLYYSGVKKDHNIYRLNLSTGETNTIYEGNTAYVTTNGDYFYYLDLENAHALTRMKLDGSEIMPLVEESTSTYNITPDGAYLYYQIDNGTNDGIYRMNMSSGSTSCLQTGHYTAIHTTSQYTFFKEFDSDTYYVVENGANTKPVPFNPEKAS